MLNKFGYKWRGHIKITTRHLQGHILDVVEFDNLIMTVGLNMLRDLFSGTISDGEIKYIALGTDNTAPAVGQTTLVAEVFRKQETSRSNLGDGILKTIHYIAPDEAIANIREIGWFAGVDATLTPDSGIMVSRVLYSRNKTNLESIQIERTDTIEEA